MAEKLDLADLRLTVRAITDSLVSGMSQLNSFGKALEATTKKINDFNQAEKRNDRTTKKLGEQVKKLTAKEKKLREENKKLAAGQKKLNTTQKKAAKSTEGLRLRMTELTKSVQVALGPLSGVSSRLTAFTGIVSGANLAIAATVGSVIALSFAMGKSIAAAGNFNQIMLRVERTSGLAAGNVKALRGAILQISTDLKTSSSEIAQAAIASGRAGIALTRDIAEFTRFAVALGQIGDIAADTVVTTIRRIQVASGEAPGTIGKLSDAITVLANSASTSESIVLNFTNEISRGIGVFGVASVEAAALATALSGVGVRMESGGTALAKFFSTMSSAVQEGGEKLVFFANISSKTTQQFKEDFGRSAVGAFRDFVAGLSQVIAEQGNVPGVFEVLGLSGQRLKAAIIPLGKQLSLLDDSLALINNSAALSGATMAGAALEAQGFNKSIEGLKTNITNAAIALGSKFEPAVTAAINSTADWFKDTDAIIEGLENLVLAITVVGAAILINMIPAMAAAATGIGGITIAARIAAGAFTALRASLLFLTTPGALIVGAIIGIVAIKNALRTGPEEDLVSKIDELVQKLRVLQSAGGASPLQKVVQSLLPTQRVELEALSRFLQEAIKAQQELVTLGQRRLDAATAALTVTGGPGAGGRRAAAAESVPRITEELKKQQVELAGFKATLVATQQQIANLGILIFPTGPLAGAGGATSFAKDLFKVQEALESLTGIAGIATTATLELQRKSLALGDAIKAGTSGLDPKVVENFKEAVIAAVPGTKNFAEALATMQTAFNFSDPVVKLTEKVQKFIDTLNQQATIDEALVGLSERQAAILKARLKVQAEFNEGMRKGIDVAGQVALKMEEAGRAAGRAFDAKEAIKQLKKIEAEATRVAKTIRSDFTDAFFEIFRGSKVTDVIDSFFRSIVDAFAKVLAEMAAMAIAKPIIIPVIQGALSALGFSEKSIAKALGNAFPTIFGSATAKAAGTTTGAGAGGAAAPAAPATIGSFVSTVAPVVALTAIALVLGDTKLTKKLFKLSLPPGLKFPTDTSLQLQTTTQGAGTTFEDRVSEFTPFGELGFFRKSEINKKQTPELVAALASVDEAIASVLIPSQIEAATQALLAQAGGGGRTGPGLGTRFDIEKLGLGPALFAAVEERLSTILGAAIPDLIDEVERAFAQISPSQQNIEVLTQTAIDIVEFDKLLAELLGKTLGEGAQAVKDLTDQFVIATKQAQRLGFAEATIIRARDRALRKLTLDFDESVLLATLGIIDPLAAALATLEETQRKRLDDVIALGGNIVAVERLNMLERQQIVEQFANQTTDSLQKLLDNLLGGSQSPLSAQLVLDNAKKQFETLQVAALGGDAVSRGLIGDSITDLLDAARTVFASGPGFFEIFGNVITTLQALTAGGPLPIGEDSIPGLLSGIGGEIASGNAGIIEELMAIREELRLLREEPLGSGTDSPTDPVPPISSTNPVIPPVFGGALGGNGGFGGGDSGLGNFRSF